MYATERATDNEMVIRFTAGRGLPLWGRNAFGVIVLLQSGYADGVNSKS